MSHAQVVPGPVVITMPGQVKLYQRAIDIPEDWTARPELESVFREHALDELFAERPDTRSRRDRRTRWWSRNGRRRQELRTTINRLAAGWVAAQSQPRALALADWVDDKIYDSVGFSDGGEWRRPPTRGQRKHTRRQKALARREARR